MAEDVLLAIVLWVEIAVLGAVALGHALVPKAPQLTLEVLCAAIRDYAADEDIMTY